jgi:hypothetical protein
VSQRLIKENSQKAVREAKRIWSDESHPVYKFIRPFAQGSIQDLKEQSVQTMKTFYYDSKKIAKDWAEELNVEELFAWADAGKEFGKDLMKATFDKVLPEGKILHLVPGLKEAVKTLKDLADKHFPEQNQMIRDRQSCITMKTCETMEALQSTQELFVELSQSVNAQQAQRLQEAATDLVKDVLLSMIRFVKEQSVQSQTVKALVSTIDMRSIEQSIRTAEVPDLEDVVDWINAGAVLTKSVLVDKLESVVQTKDGAVLVTLNHPLQWSNLKSLPKLTTAHEQRMCKFYADAQTKLRKLQKDGSFEFSRNEQEQPIQFQFASMKSLIKNGMSYQTGMIFGDRQVMTFDGKVYSIPETSDPDCTHLLARGTKRNNFALVKEKNGITLTVPEMVVSIDFNKQVRINQSSNAVQLPVESSNKRTQVKLVGDTVQIESQTGIMIECRGEKKTCLIQISTEMWDESIGLLGTNDNEADNDFEVLTGKQASNVQEFVNEFELTKKSQCQAESRSTQQRGQCPKSTQCAAFFRNTDSDLSACFSTVDPVQFNQACEEESKQCDRTEAEESVCDIVNAYRTVCSAKHIQTEAPEACESCDGRKENSKWASRGNSNQVDIVVVVSENKDVLKNNKSPADKIQKITDAVVQKLQQFNQQDIRVALVGYSGAGVHKDGHTHTIDHQQFGLIESLSRALKTLQFKGQREADILDTIDFVLDSHDFRAQSTKLMLVFGPAETEYISGHSAYQDVKEKLIDLGVTVTVFGSYDDLKEHQLGVNYDGSLYTSKKSAVQVYGEMPEMQMSRLAKATRGAIFQLDTVSGESSKQSRLEESAVEAILRQVQSDSVMCKTCVCQQTELKQLISACKVAAC